MASEVKKVMRLFEDKDVQESFSWWIVELAKRIKEKPEDLVWFFERKRQLQQFNKEVKELEKRLSGMSNDELWQLIVKEAEKAPEIRKSTMELLEEAREEMHKFHRIEAKLKKLGVIL